MVQSGGSSGTVALANAIVADVATSAERGIYIGITSLATILAPSLGPILGGIISQYAGWKWIFWFLAILGGLFFIPLLLFMPETCRVIVGDGLKEGLGPPDYAERDALAKKRDPLRFPNPLDTLVVAIEKEGFFILFFAGIVYAGFYAILSGMPSQLNQIYGFDELKVGLMYLPMAGGSIVAAFTQGRLVDWSFAREAKKLGIEVKKRKQQDLSHFPIEKARLQVAAPMLLLATTSTVIYGWVLHFRVSVAGPVIMLFVQGFALVASTQCISILIVDINPGLAGTATAAFNLIRCLLGAASTALIIPMTNKMGLGWSYTLIGGVYVLLSPMLWVVVTWGPGWRRERAEKEREKEEKKERDRRAENV
jgi:MFS family permease